MGDAEKSEVIYLFTRTPTPSLKRSLGRHSSPEPGRSALRGYCVSFQPLRVPLIVLLVRVLPRILRSRRQPHAVLRLVRYYRTVAAPEICAGTAPRPREICGPRPLRRSPQGRARGCLDVRARRANKTYARSSRSRTSFIPATPISFGLLVPPQPEENG